MCKQWGDDFSLIEFDQLNSSIFDSLADVFIKNKDQKFQLNYFTSLRGNDSINLRISQKRVEEIKNCLLKRGIDTNQLSVLGMGESKPRKIWTIENNYFLEDPKIPKSIIVELSENYISNFKEDKRKYEYIHSLNNRIEIQLLQIKVTE